jgi:hypothetical protein
MASFIARKRQVSDFVDDKKSWDESLTFASPATNLSLLALE